MIACFSFEKEAELLIMPTEKISNNVLAPNFAFGELSREEINTVLTQAGVSLLPPKRIPFVTGVRRKRKSKETVERVDDKKSEHVVPNGVTSPKEKSGKSNGHTLPLEEPAQNDATSTREDQNATETPTETPVASPVKPKPSSWAALLRTSADETKQKSKMPGPAAPSSTPKPNVSAATPQAQTTPPKFVGIADIISRYEAQFDAPLLEPRGLINNVNTCFMNVILQPLSHCPPFYNLIKTIGQHVVHSFRSKTPLLDSLIEFINEFRLDTTAPNDVNPEPYGEPFVPEYVYDALRGQKRFDSLKGRQEDAEEFLCFLLDGLHEEMVAFLKEKEDPEKKGAAAQNGSANGWLEVGPKNKTNSLQTTGFEESPISKIFGGKMRSILRCPGAKDSVNLEPFQSLPLDIQPEDVKTVEDAMGNITVPEVMHDFMSPKNVRVEATKQVYLESLPPVLILHMKRFVFDNVGGVQKLQKPVQYGAELVIQPEWMTPVLRSGSPIKYRLFGIVYHHGASAGGGHYTCDIRRQNGEWLHINDTNITPVSEQDVLLTDHNTRTSEMIHADQTAYILFYTRA